MRDAPLKPFIQLTQALLLVESLDEALGLVCETAMATLPAEHASVRVLDASEERLLSGARRGVGLEYRPMRFEPGCGVAGWVVANAQSVRIDEAEADPRFVAGSVHDQGFVPRSLVGAPLWAGRRAVGVLGVTSSEAAAFSGHDELVLTLLANCASPTLERARLERLTITDPLTLAFNNRYLLPRIREEISRAERHGAPLSVLMMDLDHFKAVNDTFGHGAGDDVLRTFAERVRELVRVSDVLLRRGGEEFVLVMPDLGGDDAVRAAERIRSRMAGEASSGGGHRIEQTVSIGVAVWRPGEGGEALEARADEAMYAAKRSGRNRVSVAP